MEYLYKLVNLLNQYDGNDRKVENEIRDLICFISDDPNYMDNELYRNIIFEASQKLRVFGYIKGTNKISQEEFYYDDLNDIKHLAVQKYYQSKVFRNNLLDKRQKDVVDCFMSLKKKRIIVSAPTSFGKTFLLREIIYLNKDTYHNILLLFPTIALLNENTESMNKLIQTLGLEYIIINNVYSKIDTNKKYIFILTPERALKLLADNEDLNIDFFFFDEVYKIDEDFDCNEDDGEEIGLKENGNRAKAFRIVLYLLAKSVKDYYLAGPYLNLANVKYGMERFVKENGVTKIQVDFEPTTHIEVDAWKKNIIEHHPVTGEKQNALYDHSQLKTKEKVQGIIKYLKNNNLGQAIFYCSTPSKAIEYTKDILDISLSCDKEIMQQYNNFIEHLKKKYDVKINGKQDSSRYWSLIGALENGIGIHHGKFPKYIQNEVLRLFNNKVISYLFCTSTIIEGVNTSAKNVVIINNSVGNKTMTAFTLKNIKGRAGRYYHHNLGRVFYMDQKQRQIEESDNGQMNFKTYDMNSISNIDIDNSFVEDLIGNNQKEKIERDKKLNRRLLPDNVFVKNRLYARDVQEKYIRYLMREDVFCKFSGLINNSNNISFFLNQHMIVEILNSFEITGIIGMNKAKVYSAVVAKYSHFGTKGILAYHFKRLQNNSENLEDSVDSAYIKTFEQIRNIVEFEIPKLLCLFESLFKQTGKLLGYNMDDFDLSSVVRFFELGIQSELGLFLVEYGFPKDTIKVLESKYSNILHMTIKEAMKFFDEEVSLINVLDSFELELFDRASHSLINIDK